MRGIRQTIEQAAEPPTIVQAEVLERERTDSIDRRKQDRRVFQVSVTSRVSTVCAARVRFVIRGSKPIARSLLAISVKRPGAAATSTTMSTSLVVRGAAMPAIRACT